MKIVAGIGSIDEYVPFVNAGADELFCGYVPYSWNAKYGTAAPLNRREVLYYNVQIGAMEELRIMRKMIERYGVSVDIVMNSLEYFGEQYEEIADIIVQCMDIGYDTFVIADPALIVYLRQQGIACKIHVSGELTETNSVLLKQLSEFDIKRMIFHRKTRIEDMRECIFKCKDVIPEYEAFLLNEMCHFTGAFCNSLHCDELCHLCLVPYQLGSYAGENSSSDFRILKALEKDDSAEPIQYMPGKTGCGICALGRLKDAGVSHLKIVGRGNYVDYMRQDIAFLRRALDLLDEVWHGENRQEIFAKRVREELFLGKCSRNCYYRE